MFCNRALRHVLQADAISAVSKLSIKLPVVRGGATGGLLVRDIKGLHLFESLAALTQFVSALHNDSQGPGTVVMPKISNDQTRRKRKITEDQIGYSPYDTLRENQKKARTGSDHDTSGGSSASSSAPPASVARGGRGNGRDNVFSTAGLEPQQEDLVRLTIDGFRRHNTVTGGSAVHSSSTAVRNILAVCTNQSDADNRFMLGLLGLLPDTAVAVPGSKMGQVLSADYINQNAEHHRLALRYYDPDIHSRSALDEDGDAGVTASVATDE